MSVESEMQMLQTLRAWITASQPAIWAAIAAVSQVIAFAGFETHSV